MKRLVFLAVAALVTIRAGAQVAVVDVASLTQNELNQIAVLAKWVESIAQLQQQVNALSQQVSLQTDLHTWSGSPVTAGFAIDLTGQGTADLTVSFGQSSSALLGSVNSLASLSNTSQSTYAALPLTDLQGQAYQPNADDYRRFAVLDARAQNLDQVSTQSNTQRQSLETKIAATLAQLKVAPTQAETQKLGAQLTVLNGQLAGVEAQRRQAADSLAEQKFANDSRAEEERRAAADLADRDDYLANREITQFMQTIKVRNDYP